MTQNRFNRKNRRPFPPSQSPTRLIPHVLRRPGLADEIYYAALCAKCGEPVFDFASANVSTVRDTEQDLIPVGSFEGAEVLRIPSDGSYVFHKECDDTGNGPWITANCVFRSDQRHEFERGGEE
jgi:hypothetical protein